MSYKPWMLAAMEEAGYMDTSEGLISRVANELNRNSGDVIDTAQFRSACVSAGVDPDSFTQSDLDRLQQKLK